jgi:hypothetical protein
METSFHWVVAGAAAIALVALAVIYRTDIILAAACLLHSDCI